MRENNNEEEKEHSYNSNINKVTKMKTIKKNISKGQHLTDIYPQIETNTILCKTLTGVGATYSEIKAKRNSIIIVPNIPVIMGKCEKHKEDNLYGVKEGIDTENVTKYIETIREKGKFIKIITTPESFYKVKNAFQELDISIDKECFILIDEAHKMIKDWDYRPNILFPMDDFFKADNKAMVSATPILPSDPRFEEQNFTIIELVPDFNYSNDLYLIHTNNILQAFRKMQSVIESEKNKQWYYCIFANSIDIIHQLIEKLGIADESSVFCSEKSTKKLKELKYDHAFSDWDIKHKSRYMFFTSRFYNAVDIELEEQPIVIFLTDTYMALHSMVDPNTDVVQALGRFRNGIHSAIHLYSTNPKFEQVTRDEIKGYIRACEEAYNQVKVLSTTAQSVGEKKLYNELLDVHPNKKFLTNGEKDYFAIDNYTDDELVKSDYGNSDLLIKRYARNKHFHIMETVDYYFKFTDEDRLSLSSNRNFKIEMRKKIVKFLDNIKDDEGTTEFDNFVQTFRENDTFIVNAYFSLGSEAIKECNFNTKKISELLLAQEYNKKQSGATFLKAISNSFEIGHSYRLPTVKNEIQRIYDQFKITPPRAITAKTINEFFEVDEKARIGNSRAIRILSSKF